LLSLIDLLVSVHRCMLRERGVVPGVAPILHYIIMIIDRFEVSIDIFN